MNAVTALAHNPFVMMLTQMKNGADTQLERDLASQMLELYLLVDENPRVIHWLNEWALKVTK